MRPVPLTVGDFLQPARVALVMWDMQKGLAGRAPDAKRVVERARLLLAAADAAGVPVIWSRHVLPPLALTNGPFLLWLMKKQRVDDPDRLVPSMQEGMAETEFVDGLAPAAHHLVLQKSQPSLFVDTPLDARLKVLGADTLVIAGVATDIGVEFTCRHAAALGYYSVVVEDAVAAYTAEAHERSLAFLRGWTTPVVSTKLVREVWTSAAATPG